METILVGIAGITASWWVAQLVLCLGYRRATRWRITPTEEQRFPSFVVFMPVRGLDATLLAAIRSVAAVDYPAFTVRILFDSQEDSAWNVVEQELARLNDPRFSVHVPELRRETCSVLCNNLVEAVGQLDDTHELIAICAADMIVPRDWLRIMAVAMHDPEVTATLGNRWYLPPETNAGSLVRWLWNAGAVVIMQGCRVPWSGGMALRLRELRTSGLLDRWANGMVEDVSVAAHSARKSKSLRFVPGLIVVDRENIELRDAFRFIRRQLLWTRLYSPHWPLVVAHAWCGAAALFGPLIFAMCAAARGESGLAAAGLLVIALYMAAMLMLLRLVESSVGATQPGAWPRFAGISPVIVAVGGILTQAVYLAALCSAALMRFVEWRRIRYAIPGPWKIQRLNYEPFRENAQCPRPEKSRGL
jgi:hypothetical protein